MKIFLKIFKVAEHEWINENVYTIYVLIAIIISVKSISVYIIKII